MLRRYLLALLIVVCALPAFAAGEKPLTLTDRIDREITIVENGVPIQKRLPAASAEPGAELIYTLSYTNTSAAPVTNPRFSQQVPALAIYVDGSAFGVDATIVYSVDGGATYDTLDRLQVIDAESGKPRPAAAADITHIRWQLAEIPAGVSGELGYHYRIK